MIDSSSRIEKAEGRAGRQRCYYVEICHISISVTSVSIVVSGVSVVAIRHITDMGGGLI